MLFFFKKKIWFFAKLVEMANLLQNTYQMIIHYFLQMIFYVNCEILFSKNLILLNLVKKQFLMKEKHFVRKDGFSFLKGMFNNIGLRKIFQS